MLISATIVPTLRPKTLPQRVRPHCERSLDLLELHTNAAHTAAEKQSMHDANSLMRAYTKTLNMGEDPNT